jgi:flagellar hook-associated protein 3 FlgL
MSTTKRVNRSSDDPSAAARAERALAAEMRTDANQRAVDASETAMTLSEGALADAGELMQQAREVMVEAGNAAYTDEQRKVLADKLTGIRTQLLAVANRQDASGNFIFAGQSADQMPFIDAPGGMQYRGTGGENGAASGEPLPLTVDGQAAWMRARSGNGVFETSASISTGTAWIDGGRVTNPSALTGASYSLQFSVAAGVTTYSVLQNGSPVSSGQPYTSGQAIEVDGMSMIVKGAPADMDQFDITPSTPDSNVFDVLDRAISGLNTQSRSGTQIAQANSTNLAALDSVLGTMQSARSSVGETLNRIDSITGRLDATRLAAQGERDNAEGLDMARAISDFKTKQTGYDAALQGYAMVQKLSLFNYLG